MAAVGQVVTRACARAKPFLFRSASFFPCRSERTLTRSGFPVSALSPFRFRLGSGLSISALTEFTGLLPAYSYAARQPFISLAVHVLAFVTHAFARAQSFPLRSIGSIPDGPDCTFTHEGYPVSSLSPFRLRGLGRSWRFSVDRVYRDSHSRIAARSPKNYLGAVHAIGSTPLLCT